MAVSKSKFKGKHPKHVRARALADAKDVPSPDLPIKRGRGRPRIHPLVTPPMVKAKLFGPDGLSVKRPRGRPPKGGYPVKAATLVRYLRGASRPDEHHDVGHSPLGAQG